MPIDPKNLKSLPEKNEAEEKRLVKNLELHLKELRHEVDEIMIETLRKKLK